MTKKGESSGEKGEEDHLLWKKVTQTVTPYDVLSLKGFEDKKSVVVSKKETAKKLKKKLERTASFSSDMTAIQKGVSQPLTSFLEKKMDRATETKLKRGKLSIEARLDMHGMTQREAFDALLSFLQRAISSGKRTVLVITGKGQKNQGVLKRMLPLWLEDARLRPYIITMRPASIKDGGSGAFYIRLKK